MELSRSNYIIGSKPILKKLLEKLLKKYEFASVLAADGREMLYSVSASGKRVMDRNMMGRRGFCVRVYDHGAYAEYASIDISEDKIPSIIACIEKDLSKMAEGFARPDTPILSDQPANFVKCTSYLVHPEELGDEAIVKKICDIREYVKSKDERLLDVSVNFTYQYYNKLFLSKNKDIEQNVMWSCGSLAAMAPKGEEIKMSYKGFSTLGGAELLDKYKDAADGVVKECIDLLSSEPMPAGEYECICSPEVTGMIVHEAFGHGVEMDMFVKDRALAKDFVGKQIASPLVTMRDGAASATEVASYFFDDEGVLAHDTLVIDKGKLVAGYSDAVSAARLGTNPTGNGRRESVERKTYTRMTNTFFEGGSDKLEDMIASVKYGMLLESPSSGMEDPKNWGIQCMVNVAREIKDGKLTGKVFSPCVLTGYVPDLLASISAMSETAELCGSGACGKGHKEWVKVSDGGPWIKAKIRLG